MLDSLGDYDPSGVDLTRAVEQGIPEVAPDADSTFEPSAVTLDQSASMQLPTRPTKTTDSRSNGFQGESSRSMRSCPADLRVLGSTGLSQPGDTDALQRRQEGRKS